MLSSGQSKNMARGRKRNKTQWFQQGLGQDVPWPPPSKAQCCNCLVASTSGVQLLPLPRLIMPSLPSDIRVRIPLWGLSSNPPMLPLGKARPDIMRESYGNRYFSKPLQELLQLSLPSGQYEFCLRGCPEIRRCSQWARFVQKI